jgi:UDP-N-acetylmuramyl pentapeptide synthase
MWRSVFPPKVDILLLECDVDFKGEMDIELSMFHPDIAIMTEVDLVHTHQLDTLEQVIVEQSKLLRSAQDLCMYSIQLQQRLWVYLDSEMDTVLYSLDPWPQSNAHLTWSGHHYIQQEEDIKAQFQCKSDAWTVHISTNLLWYEHASAMSVWLQLVEIITQRKQISYMLPSHLTVIWILQSGRYSIFSWKQGSVLIDSTYNAAPKSMRMMIENTVRLRDKVYSNYPIWLALWDMRELGDHTQDCHEQLAHWIMSQNVAKVFLVGQSMLEYIVPLLKQSNIDVTHFADSTSLGMYMADLLLTQETTPVILFKWSQNTIFLEEAVKQCLADPWDITKLCRQGAAWVWKKWF